MCWRRHPAFAASIVGRNPLGGGGNFGIQASLEKVEMGRTLSPPDLVDGDRNLDAVALD